MAASRQELSLDQLREGDRARIIEVEGDDPVSIRLMEMGLVPGEEIELLGVAPFGDPMEFHVRGYRVSLRAGEARRLRVELLSAAN